MYNWKKAFTEDEIRDWKRFGCDSREATIVRLNYISAYTPNQEYKLKTNVLSRKLQECFSDEEQYQKAYHWIHSEREANRADQDFLAVLKCVAMDILDYLESRESERSFYDDGSDPYYEMPEELQKLCDKEDELWLQQFGDSLPA